MRMMCFWVCWIQRWSVASFRSSLDQSNMFSPLFSSDWNQKCHVEQPILYTSRRFPTGPTQVLSIKAVKWFRWKDVKKTSSSDAWWWYGKWRLRGTKKKSQKYQHITQSMQLKLQVVANWWWLPVFFLNPCVHVACFYLFSCLEKFANHSWSSNLW